MFGKVIGGGMPLAAFGGPKHAVMEQLAPLGPVYQAGTLSGNPVATACGLATLARGRASRGFYEALGGSHRVELVAGIAGRGRNRLACRWSADSQGGMFGFFFPKVDGQGLPQNYGDGDGDRQGTIQPLLPRHARPRLLSSRRRCTKQASSAAAHSEQDVADTVAATLEVLKAENAC